MCTNTGILKRGAISAKKKRPFNFSLDSTTIIFVEQRLDPEENSVHAFAACLCECCLKEFCSDSQSCSQVGAFGNVVLNLSLT